ncbi:MAG: substrate-binding periplasmic protein [Rickettsiaceae bacterium]
MKALKILFGIIIIICANPLYAKNNKLITLCSDERCPYTCKPNTNEEGYLVELAKEAFGIVGIKVKYQSMPWFECLMKVESGELDGILGITSAQDNHNLSKTQTPQAQSFIGVFTHANSTWQYDGFDSLKNKTMPIILNYEINKGLTRFVFNQYLHNSQNFIIEDGMTATYDAIMNLYNKRADVFIVDQKVFHYYTNKENIGQFFKISGSIKQNNPLPLYIAFSNAKNNSKYYITILTNGINTMKHNGKLQKIQRKYGIEK